MSDGDLQPEETKSGNWPPKLFAEQSTGERFVGLIVGPIVLGLICGWLVGVSGAIYTVITLLAILGGLAAGYEHVSLIGGAARGAWGGALFALTISETHRAIGNLAKASTPKPIEEIIIIFAIFSAVLGLIASALRRRRENKAPATV
jgi:hypothetical protein